MNYFVIGVSGITCGGKTTITQLLQRSFPWCRTLHQDTYFHDDDDPRHVRLPDVENHVNYEISTALEMKKMEEDLLDILKEGHQQKVPNGDADSETNVPNLEVSTIKLLESVADIGIDTSKYRNIPVLIVEGFLLFESQVIYDACDARFFLTLTNEECRERRSQRTTYEPPDVPGYFEKCIWPEFVKHYESYIANRTSSIKVFHGSKDIPSIWKQSLEIIANEMDNKFPHLVLNT